MSLTFFDANCILGRWPEGGPTLEDPSALLQAMHRLGIAKALVRHSLGWQHDAAFGNALLAQQLAGQACLLPCWAALPPACGELGPLDGWLASLASNDVRAICLYPTAHGYPLAPWQCDALLGPLAERRYVLLLERAEAGWEQIAWLCGAYPALRVVLLNPGYRVLRPLYALLEHFPNAHVELSTLANFRGIEDLAVRFGAERLLLGTNQPRSEGAGIISALNWADLMPPQRQAIAAGNLERLLGEVQR